MLLDTNVISAMRNKKTIKKQGKEFEAWLQQTKIGDCFLSVVTIAELEVGVLSKERQDPKTGLILRKWLDADVLPLFTGRILNLDIPTAVQTASLHVPNPKSYRDAFIAATALVHSQVVVTRNTKDFKDTGVELLNPWEFDPSH